MGNQPGYEVIQMPGGPAAPGSPAAVIDQRCTYQCRQCGASAPARIATQQFRPHNCRSGSPVRFVGPNMGCQHNQLQQQLRSSPVFQQFQQAMSMASNGGGGGGMQPQLMGMMRSPMSPMGGGGLMNSCSQTSFVNPGGAGDMGMSMPQMQCMNMGGQGGGIGMMSGSLGNLANLGNMGGSAMSMGGGQMVRPCLLQTGSAGQPMAMMMRQPRVVCPQPLPMAGMAPQPTQRFLAPCKSTSAMMSLGQDSSQGCFNCVRSPNGRPMGLNM